MVAAPGGVSSGNSGDDGAAAPTSAAGGASTAAALTAPTSSSSPQTPEAPAAAALPADDWGASAEGVAGVAALPPLSDVDATGGPSVRRTRQLCWARSSVHGLHAIIGCRAAMLVRARSMCCQCCPCCRGRPAHLPVTLQLAALQPKMRRLRSISVGAYIYKVEWHNGAPNSNAIRRALPQATFATDLCQQKQRPPAGPAVWLGVTRVECRLQLWGSETGFAFMVRYAASVAIREPGQQRGPLISSLTGRPPILVSQARP
jgi:hypothetical protein